MGERRQGRKEPLPGLKFNIDGEIHFGWARLTLVTAKGGFSTTLTGYAYETIPNKSIVAGKTKGPDDKASAEKLTPASFTAPAPATLGMLAMGSPGLSIWRRKESANAAQ